MIIIIIIVICSLSRSSKPWRSSFPLRSAPLVSNGNCVVIVVITAADAGERIVTTITAGDAEDKW